MEIKEKLLASITAFLVILALNHGDHIAFATEEASPSASQQGQEDEASTYNSEDLSPEDSEASSSAELSDEVSEDRAMEATSVEDPGEQDVSDQSEDSVLGTPDESEGSLDPTGSEEPETSSLEDDTATETVTNSVRIEGQKETLFYGDINHQSVTFMDTLEVVHSIDHPTALGAVLNAAQQNNIVYEVVDYGAFGFYLQSLNGEQPSGNFGWLYKVNGISPMVGAGDYEVVEGDDVLFFYGDWQNPNQPLLLVASETSIYLGDTIQFQTPTFDESVGDYIPTGEATIQIKELGTQLFPDDNGVVNFTFPSTGTFTVFAEASGQIRSLQLSIIVSPIPASENQQPTEAQINQAVQDAADYLMDQQDEEGKISNLGISAWAAMSLSAAGTDPNTDSHSPSLMEYLAANNDQLTLVTDWERQTLAILAAGTNPENFGGEDCIQRILDFFQDGQLGDPNLLNDDIFGILALLGSGVDPNDPVILDSLDFLVPNQNEDGGFSFAVGGDSDTNTTAAALQALVYASEIGDFDFGEPVGAAKIYLLENQNADGGFPYMPGSASDTSSTAWIVLAFNALDIDPLSLTTRFDLHPISYMLDMQNANGSFSWMSGLDGDPFTTSFVIQALSESHWPIVGEFFGAEEIDDENSSQEVSEDSTDDGRGDSADDLDEEDEESDDDSLGEGSKEEPEEGQAKITPKPTGEVLGEALVPDARAQEQEGVIEEIVTDTNQRAYFFFLVFISGFCALFFLRRSIRTLRARS